MLVAEDADPAQRYTVRRLKQCDEEVVQALLEKLAFKNAHKKQILELGECLGLW